MLHFHWHKVIKKKVGKCYSQLWLRVKERALAPSLYIQKEPDYLYVLHYNIMMNFKVTIKYEYTYS